MDLQLGGMLDVVSNILEQCDLESVLHFSATCRNVHQETRDWMFRTAVHVQCHDIKLSKPMPVVSGNVNYFVKLSKFGYVVYYIKIQITDWGWSFGGNFGLLAPDGEAEYIMNTLEIITCHDSRETYNAFEHIAKGIIYRCESQRISPFDVAFSFVHTGFHLLTSQTVKNIHRSCKTVGEYFERHRRYKFIVNGDA